MHPTFVRLAELTPEERAACDAYQKDATYFHACSQGWSGQFPDSPKFSDFLSRCPDLARHLDTAINKCRVETAGIVYSGHGLGLSVLGSLLGEPDDYVGFRYSYAGYTSTSLDRAAAENFLRTRSSGSRTPILLAIHLTPPQNALLLGNHESEVLVPRGATFSITQASRIRVSGVSQDVLLLKLA